MKWIFELALNTFSLKRDSWWGRWSWFQFQGTLVSVVPRNRPCTWAFKVKAISNKFEGIKEIQNVFKTCRLLMHGWKYLHAAHCSWGLKWLQCGWKISSSGGLGVDDIFSSSGYHCTPILFLGIKIIECRMKYYHLQTINATFLIQGYIKMRIEKPCKIHKRKESQ